MFLNPFPARLKIIKKLYCIWKNSCDPPKLSKSDHKYCKKEYRNIKIVFTSTKFRNRGLTLNTLDTLHPDGFCICPSYMTEWKSIHIRISNNFFKTSTYETEYSFANNLVNTNHVFYKSNNNLHCPIYRIIFWAKKLKIIPQTSARFKTK